MPIAAASDEEMSHLLRTPRDFLVLILRQVKRSKRIVLGSLLAIGQSCYVLLPALLGLLIDRVFVQRAWSLYWLITFPCLWLAASFILGVSKLFVSSVTQDVRKFSKALIFRYLVNLPTSVYVTRDAGEIEHLMQELSFDARYCVSESIPFLIRSMVTLFVAVMALAISSFGVMLCLLGWTLVYVPMSYWIARRSTVHVSDSLSRAADVSAAVVEVIQNHELVPAFGTGKYEIARFEQLLEREKTSFDRAQQGIDFSDLLLKTMQVCLPLSIALFLMLADRVSRVSPGLVTSIFSLTLILTTQIGQLSKGLLGYLEIKERMSAALTKLRTAQTTSGVVPNHQPAHWSIRLHNVSFRYEETHEALHDVNLDIQEGEKVGIVGYSGAGKTTLVKLLRGTYQPTSGTIYIGDCDLQTINRQILAKGVAEVSQAIPLFHRTVRENVAYGCSDISDKAVWRILERAQMAESVKGMSGGLSAVVGVKGQKLSGGERARIGIARAFVRDARIIILDEAMASLDTESEWLVQKGLEQLIVDRTVIVIAHRFATLRQMDRIVVMDAGRIIAVGTHDELIARNSLYKRMWSNQAWDPRIEPAQQ